jgi:hypothetical protein
MRSLAYGLLIFLISFHQQTKPTHPAQTGLEKNGTQREEQKTENNKRDRPPTQIINSSNVQEPTSQPKEDASYDPYKDTLYRWYLRATIIGVVGGLLGIYFLLRSVNAAHKAADAVMDAEGALLIVDVTDCILSIDASKAFVGSRIDNIGRTTAMLFSSEALFQLGDDRQNPPMPSLYDRTDRLPSVYYLAAEKGSRCTTFLCTVAEPLIGISEKPFKFVAVADSEKEQVDNGTKFLWHYGFVRYRDRFKRAFELRYCHRYEPKLVPRGGFVVGGPAEFNRSTRCKEKKH